jgi:hypothetical protein
MSLSTGSICASSDLFTTLFAQDRFSGENKPSLQWDLDLWRLDGLAKHGRDQPGSQSLHQLRLFEKRVYLLQRVAISDGFV